ncbi:MFS transporter [Phenylobacterium hankyongense]|uniref:MFS transporter n=1 Tax=Phenylobacterium hankyongense TaxID=1813876 RepID=A0A328B2B6_9CAUL|nr:MFS transporter [Phenylobacterium hankyongense]RAK61059.1 MFS transporter [Phenylobacterium hankyongense]
MSHLTEPCARGSARAAGAVVSQTPKRAQRRVLAGTVLGSSLAFIDSSAVNLTLPVIQQRLGGDLASAQWIMNAYSLMLSALVLSGGAAADRYGRKRVFIVGVAVFTAASLACALAPSLPVLIAARAVQGIGAALMTPASLALLGATFEEKGRGQAVGIWAGAGGLMSALGPVLGGWLTDTVSWRAVFVINLPIAAVAVWLVAAGARESRGTRSGPVDWAGAAAVTAGLALITWGLTDAPRKGFADPLVIAALVLGLAGLAAFVLIERRAENPMTPLKLFRSVSFSGLNGLTLLLYAAFGGALFLLPFQLIRAHHYPPAAAGAALLPLSVGLAVLSPLAGRLASRFGARALLTAGPTLVGVGFALLAWRAGDGGYWSGVFPGLAVLALGMGVAVAPLTDAVLGAVPGEFEGAASGINNATARVAGLLAVALVGFVLGAADPPAVAAGYRVAMIVAAVGSVAAGLVGWLTVRPLAKG